eukprot:2578225-Amphidinium_carterae.1
MKQNRSVSDHWHLVRLVVSQSEITYEVGCLRVGDTIKSIMSANRVDEWVQFTLQCVRVAAGLGKQEMLRMLGLVEASKMYLVQRARQFVQLSETAPVVFEYSCDCTPLRHRVHVSADTVPHSHMRSSGQSAGEFFVHHLFVSCADGTGDVKRTVVFRDCLELTHGKSMRAQIPVSLCCPGLSLYPNAPRVSVFHQVSDRGVTHGYRAAVSGFVALQSAQQVEDGVHASNKNSLYQWHSSVGCALHDAHNGLKWALQVHFESGMLRDVFAGLACYRQSFRHIPVKLGDWLLKVLVTKPIEELPSASELMDFYSVLGMPASLLDTVCSEMHLCWDATKKVLLISTGFMSKSDGVAILSGCLLDCWRFPSFSDSRWLSIGLSCRGFTLAMSLGFKHCFDWMRQQRTISPFYSSGADQFQDSCISFCLVAGLSSYLTDSFVTMVMGNGAVASQQEALHEAVVEELTYVEGLQVSVWKRLSSFVSIGPGTVRDMVLHSMHLSHGFLTWRVFEELQEAPWCLLAGDLASNLSALKESETCPDEPITRKIQTLLRMGMSVTDMVTAVKMLGNVSWSSYCIERFHASSATVKRFHPEYSKDSLSARFCLHYFRSFGQ